MPPPVPPGTGPWDPAALSKNGVPPTQNQAVSNERTTEIIKNLTEEQDLRKVLQEQVSTLKKQLKERDDNLRFAAFEIEESSKQIKKTREEFRLWQSEMDELRERIRKLEDYRSSAKPLIEDIYRYLDRDKEPAKFKAPPNTSK